jgi:hypothetical protein
MMKSYPIEQSPLFRLANKRRFAELIGLDLKSLKQILSTGSANYYLGSVPKADGTSRTTETPKSALKRVQKKFLRLLSRVETPGYLHSGVRGRSYMTNASVHAAAHPGGFAVAKIDIKKFFPSTTFEHVKRGMRETFQCSPDIAYLIAKLCTYETHVPTGSPISCLAAFYAHKTLFDALFAIARKKGWTLTCYVDDITISGRNVNRKSLLFVKRAVAASGLALHKERVYSNAAPKLITGNVVCGINVKLPNRRQRAIYEGFSSLREKVQNYNPVQFDAEVNSMKGRINEAAHLDQSFRARKTWLLKTLSEISAIPKEQSRTPDS